MFIKVKEFKKSSKGKPHNIHECLKWIYTLLFITGGLTFYLKDKKFRLTRFSKMYSYVTRFLLVGVFIAGFTIKLNDEQMASAMLDHLPPILKFTVIFESITCTVTYIGVSLVLDRKKYAHIALAERFRCLDECMQKDFPQISWNYEKTIRKYTPMTIMVVFYYAIFSMIYLVSIMHCSCGLTSTFMIALPYACITLAPGFVSFVHIGSTDLLRLRYRLIRKMIVQFKSTGKGYESVYRLSIYCQRYTELILDINEVFGTAIAGGIFYDFGILTNLVYLICEKTLVGKSDLKEYIFIVLFMTPRVYKVLMVPIYGKVLDTERRRCVHEIVTYEDSFKKCPMIQELFCPFLHWKMQHDYTVTVGRIMHCNLNVIFLVLNGIANYVLILIQLQFQQNSITSRAGRNLDWRKSVELIDTTRR